MPRLVRSLGRIRRLKQLQLVIIIVMVVLMMHSVWYTTSIATIKGIQLRSRKRDRKRLRLMVLSALIRESDVSCRNELRVNRHTFDIICEMLRDVGGLSGTRNMSLQEIVAIFLYTLAHHKKNRSLGQFFFRSGETVSRQFNLCLRALLKLHEHLLHKPTAITDDCEDDRWKPFKNCLGALDGTYINVRAPSQERGKYRTRKGTIAMNVLGVCAPNMQFIYVLPGWEGSAHDVRVLRNALSRPNGFKVPRGKYYLADAGYTNCEGFLTPYRGQRYHLKEWTDRQPESAEEYYNLKHARARNVIERCFGLLKGRWSILRSPSFVLGHEKNVFDEWVKNHKKAKGLFGAPFPHYDTLVEIYAKDKATGDASESFIGAINNMDDEFANDRVLIETDDEDDANSVTDSGKRPIKKELDDPTQLKKRKFQDLKGKGKVQRKTSEADGLVSSFESVSSNFAKIFENINENLGTMACAWSKAEEREQKLDDKANNVLEEILKLNGFSPSEALEAATILMAEDHKLRVFYQAPMSLKRQYISDLIKKK